MIVVLDTNIWKSQIYLQSEKAAATRFFLRQKKAKLGLPEVIKKEVETHFRRDVLKLISEMKGKHKELLLPHFGKLTELVLPNEKDVVEAASRIFENVGVEILHVPFSLKSAEASFEKVIEKVAPSSSDKEQFKDGVIWADCMELLKTDDVFLVTKDRAFYKDRAYELGPSPNLLAELLEASHKLTLLPDLTDLFSEIKDKIILDDRLFVHAFLIDQEKSITSFVSENGFELGEITIAKRKLFATENARRLFVQFTIESVCPDLGAVRKPAILTAEGECRYDVDAEAFGQFVIGNLELRFEMLDGTHTAKRYGFAAANFTIGHKYVEHIVRSELE